ncbi:putative integrase [Orientia tsutsugamushi str. Ikeda]|uniref:Putative integrase n=1 Tax=Orientia tsutsugamushi (strain Ikeda) TaxID=334380 RepID=B3CUK8_ORITI|nr:site-specific integrase [Orientia tsutsugamushi]BAG41055.1 putative integrase [Orientia tsutsugamushi str. Ikeda]BAG41142.1 putative integrase [Orientia tsutsugamushi str. Ikeda]
MESIILTLKLTDKLIRKIKIPTERTSTIKDKIEPGLQLRISRSGRKTCSFEKKFRKEGIKMTIGVFPDLSIKEARKKARELKRLMAKGIDPREEKRQQQIAEDEKRLKARQDITFKELCYKYIEEYAKIYTIYWQKDTARIHNYAKPLFLKKISDIKSNDIEQIFNDISKDGKYATANQFLITLSSIFNKAIKWELIDRNPTLKIDKHKMQARERRLSYDEMSKFLHVLCGEATPLIRDFALLALYTGARKTNVLEMEWDNIDFVRKIWHIPKTKNGKAQNIPLTDEIIEILQARKLTSKSKWVLSTDKSKSGHLEYPYRGWYKICKKAGIKNLRIHDLRRTFASCMADEGAGQYIISAALNHSDIKSTSIYTKVSLEPVRQYMSKVTQMISDCSKIDI